MTYSKRRDLALYRIAEGYANKHAWHRRKGVPPVVYTWLGEMSSALASLPVRSHERHLSAVIGTARQRWSKRKNATARPVFIDYEAAMKNHRTENCPDCRKLLKLSLRPDTGLVTVVPAETGVSTRRHVLSGALGGLGVSGAHAGVMIPTFGLSSVTGLYIYMVSVMALTGGSVMGHGIAEIRRKKKSKRLAITFDLLTAQTPLELRVRDAILGIEKANEAESASSSGLLTLARAGRDLTAEMREIVLSAALIVRLSTERDAAAADGSSATVADRSQAIAEAEASLARRLDSLDRYLADLAELRIRVAELEAHTQIEGLDVEVTELLASSARDDEAARRLDELSADTRALMAGVSEIVAILSGKNALPPAAADQK